MKINNKSVFLSFEGSLEDELIYLLGLDKIYSVRPFMPVLIKELKEAFNRGEYWDFMYQLPERALELKRGNKRRRIKNVETEEEKLKRKELQRIKAEQRQIEFALIRAKKEQERLKKQIEREAAQKARAEQRQIEFDLIRANKEQERLKKQIEREDRSKQPNKKVKAERNIEEYKKRRQTLAVIRKYFRKTGITLTFEEALNMPKRRVTENVPKEYKRRLTVARARFKMEGKEFNETEYLNNMIEKDKIKEEAKTYNRGAVLQWIKREEKKTGVRYTVEEALAIKSKRKEDLSYLNNVPEKYKKRVMMGKSKYKLRGKEFNVDEYLNKLIELDKKDR